MTANFSTPIRTNVLRWASFSSTTCVCCGENFRTAAITLINVLPLEFMLFVKYLEKWKKKTKAFVIDALDKTPIEIDQFTQIT